MGRSGNASYSDANKERVREKKRATVGDTIVTLWQFARPRSYASYASDASFFLAQWTREMPGRRPTCRQTAMPQDPELRTVAVIPQQGSSKLYYFLIAEKSWLLTDCGQHPAPCGTSARRHASPPKNGGKKVPLK